MTTISRERLVRQVADSRPPARPRAERDVRLLLREVLALIGPHTPATEDDEVLLSVEISGVRYTLTHRRTQEDHPAVPLSSRECEIARLISAGHTNKTVAAILEISLWTVDTHIRRIFAKLGVRSRSAMVARLAERGLLSELETLP